VRFVNNVVTINPASNLISSQSGQDYVVTVENGVITDAATVRNEYLGLTLTFGVADSVAPTATAFSPVQGASDVALTSDIVLTFNEPMQLGSGNVVLTPASSGSALTVAVAASGCTEGDNVR
jgi:hypothetical protein